MKNKTPFLAIKHPIVIVAGCIAVAFIYYFTKHSGIGISPDSVHYYSVALNILQHGSFTDFNNLPLVVFPVGYPVFLAFFCLPFSCGTLAFAPAVNGALLFGVLVLTRYIIKELKDASVLYQGLLLGALACSPALLEVYSMLWSETLFIFLSILFIIAIKKYLNAHTIRTLFAAAQVAAIAFETRFAGITLLLTGGFLIFFDGNLSLIKKIKHLLLFGIMASALTAINLIRNLLVTDSMAGVREKALRSVADNLMQLGAVLSTWLPFLSNREKLAACFFIVVFFLVLLRIIFTVLQQQFYPAYENVIAVFFITYSSFIVAIASFSRFEDLSNRLLAPLYIPLLIICSSWLVSFSRKQLGIKKIMLSALLVLFYAGLIFNFYQQNAAAWEGIKDAGIPGYTEDSWKNSETVRYLNKNKNEFTCPLYADAHDAVYFLAQLHALPLPHKEIQNEKNSLLRQANFCVIWFNDGINADLIDIDFIKKYKTVVKEIKLSDGIIYFFTNKT